LPYNITNSSCTFAIAFVSAKAPLYSNTSINYLPSLNVYDTYYLSAVLYRTKTQRTKHTRQLTNKRKRKIQEKRSRSQEQFWLFKNVKHIEKFNE